MNYGLILAGGVGQRMRNSGTPKQFLEVFKKPIIIYTLEQFEKCGEIDGVVVVCNAGWLGYMKELLKKYGITKVVDVVAGGKDRQKSTEKGVLALQNHGVSQNDVVVIHDGVRPMVRCEVICENIRIAGLHGCAMTVSPVQETVVVTDNGTAGFHDFKRRDYTYALTSPQSFRFSLLMKALNEPDGKKAEIPILDAAIAYASLGHEVCLVKDSHKNVKITTPEDYYVFKALLELEENRSVFGL